MLILGKSHECFHFIFNRLQKFKMNIANAVITQDNSSLQSMGTDQLLDLFSLDQVIQPCVKIAWVKVQPCMVKSLWRVVVKRQGKETCKFLARDSNPQPHFYIYCDYTLNALYTRCFAPGVAASTCSYSITVLLSSPTLLPLHFVTLSIHIVYGLPLLELYL